MRYIIRIFLRGDIYYADLERGVDSEQEGYLPVVIIQNNVGNEHSPTVIVAAITSQKSGKEKTADPLLCWNRLRHGTGLE